MRTTINIDEDVLIAVQERARRDKRTAGEVLSELARQALVGTVMPTKVSSSTVRGFEPLPHRGAAVSNSLIDRIREDEAE